MSGLAVSRTDPAAAAPKPVKPARISPRIRQAIEALLSGKCQTQRAAAELAGLSEEHLCRELKKDQIRAFITRRTSETIGNAQMPAAATLIKLLGADSEHARKDVAIHLLRISGHAPPESGTNISIINNIAPGYVVKLRHVDDGGVNTALATNTANPLIEQGHGPDVVRGRE